MTNKEMIQVIVCNWQFEPPFIFRSSKDCNIKIVLKRRDVFVEDAHYGGLVSD